MQMMFDDGMFSVKSVFYYRGNTAGLLVNVSREHFEVFLCEDKKIE